MFQGGGLPGAKGTVIEDQLPVLSCPRCSVGEISARTLQCSVCGFSAEDEVLTATVIGDEVFDTVARELAGRFELGEPIRKGRGTLLYDARDLKEEQRVALQLLPLAGPVGADLLRVFESAAAVAQGLRHPHVIGVIGVGYSRSLLWYSTVPQRHTPLTDRLAAECPMALDRCLELLEQAGSGLDYLHRSGLLHGCLTPESVETDDRGWIRVADASLRYQLVRGAGPRSPWRTLLDPRYTAPELFGPRPSGPASDQYALAAIAVHGLVGAPPAGRSDAELAGAIRSARPDLPHHVVVALVRALEGNPLERFGSIMEFLASLTQPARASFPVLQPAHWTPSQQVLLPSPGRIVERRRGWRWAIAAIAAVVAVGAIWLGTGGRGASRDGDFVMAPQQVRPPQPEPVAPEPPVAQEAPARPLPTRPAPAPTSVPVVPSPPGRLFVNSTPWGVVYLDGERVGNSPQANLEVPVGEHVLRIVREGYQPFEERIRVRSGEEIRLTEIVLEPIRP